MKNNTLSIILASLFGVLSPSLLLAQKKEKNTPPAQAPISQETNPLYRIYQRAVQFEDFPVARMALMQLMMQSPEKTAYEDTLVMLYFSSGMPAQAVVLGRQRLEKNPDNAQLAEVVAMAEETTGLLKDALDRYEQLEKKNSRPQRKYKIAALQYRLKRYGECQASVNQLMSMPAADTLKVNFVYNDGSNQMVQLKAAALNVLGMAAYDLGQLEDAEALFQAALQLDKDFVQPKINLNALNQEKNAREASQKKDGTPSTPTDTAKKPSPDPKK
ncbi:MAG: tetratricopeptide repeat protein [Flavobacteriales bacterium]|nr:tetratricopeptide repeat protein [Flavobacteriales bacterium]MDW8433097.1 tetratricopeptide repeat protein [Flavobacteriales bacterium]